MERISAACAMEWSVELERGLRSKKPGLKQALKGRYLLTDKFLLSDVRRDPHLFDPSELYFLMSFLNHSGQLMRDLSLMESRPVEAILQMGPRIEQWSKEHSYPTDVLKMFGLVPGEDRLFANTILLRLAHAFKTGDTHTRLCVLKVFLLELRYRRRKGKTYNGILAKQRVSNILELLKRVKIVFDAGDVDSKALALRLLGCWADIAKGSAEIRYMILSKLDSINVLEAKASLFAAGCISELSEDFASVALEIMINMMNSQQTSSSIKVAGARTISRMGYSSVLACRAYKAGKKLILDSSHEEFIVGMLMSLTKLASKSLLLISEQVDLLLQFISQNSASCVQAMALRCLYCLLAGGVCRFPVNASVITMLVNLLDATNLPLDSQCKLLQMLRKLFQSSIPSPYTDIPEFAKLVQSVEIAAQSPITSKRFLALHLLVDISRNHRVAMEMIPGDNVLAPLPNRVILLVIDLIVGLVKTVLPPCKTASELKKECQSLLNLLIIVVEEYPTLGVLVLDKIRLPVEYMVDMCVGDLNSRTLDSSVHGISGGEKHAPKLVFCMYKFVESCIETLDEANSITAQVHQLFDILVNAIRQRSLFNHDFCTIFLYVLLHSRLLWAYMRKENNGTCNVAKNLGISLDDNWVEHETQTLEYSKKMMEGRDNWAAYRAGKQAACQGAWFTVAYIFWQLMKKVQSDNCSYWLKSLSLFAQAESTILILILPKAVSEIWIAPCGSVLEEVGDGVTWKSNSQNSIEKLTEAFSGVRSAAEMLASATTLDQTFYFQRWFLALRAKTLEAVVDILKILSSDPCKTQSIGNCRCFEGSTEFGILGPAQHVHLLALFLTRMAFRLNRLVQEFELLATSFMGIDSRSFRSISRLALNCSLLAFCTGFVIYYPHLQFYEKSMLLGLENLEKCSHITLLKDVMERLWHIDDETSKNLKALLALIADPNICFNLHPRTLISRVGHRERETLVVCKFAVSRILHIHEETKKLKNEGVPSQVSRTGVQLLSDILKMWMGISFQTPNYFFQVRPCIRAELFAFSADTRTSDEISVLPGYHLSLSLCLQLRNAPTVLPTRITKLYCILSCRPTYRMTRLHGESKECMQSDSQVWETDDALDLNDKLMLFVTEGMKRTGGKRSRTGDDSGFVWSCVCFEPNERGQGFSTCLLDVSTFPLGSYRIKWHSCCLDSQGSYWSLLPLNTGPLFTVKKPTVTL